MTKLVALLVLFVLQYSTTSSYTWDYYIYPDNDIYLDNDIYKHAEDIEHTLHECPEGESFISRNDLKILIDHIAKDTFKFQESLMDYFKKAMDVNGQYQELFGEDTKQIKHLLEQIELDHLNLESLVQETIKKSKEADGYEKQLSRVNSRSQKLFTDIDSFVKTCATHTGNQKLVKRSGHRKNKISINEHISSKGACGSLKDVYGFITEQLNQFQHEYLKEVLDLIENIINLNQPAVASKNDQLKKKAMIQNEMVIDVIIKLQDDYLHLKSNISAFNITQILQDINNNLESSEQLLIELEKTVQEYFKQCLINNNNVKDKTWVRRDSSISKILKNNIKRDGNSFELIDQLVETKIKDIRNEINRNVTDIFKEMDERVHDPNMFVLYLEKLLPKPEELDVIQKTQESLNNLKTNLDQSSIGKIQEQWKISHEMLQNIEKAKADLNLSFYNEAKPQT